MLKPTSSTTKTSLIVPCAGFGTRVGSPPAKELLPHPHSLQPLIDTSLDIAENNNWPLILITRPEKKILIDYVQAQQKKRELKINWVLVKPTKEWPESILVSQNFWDENNLLVLPDTEWQPQAAEQKIVQQLENYEVSYGLFNTEDLTTWGAVQISDNDIKVCEKPKKKLADFYPWGLIAFKKSVGQILFEALLQSTMDHEIKTLPLKAQKYFLNSFTDLTRSP